MTRTSTQPRQEHSADDSVQPACRGTAPVVTAEGRLRRVRRLANHIVPRQVAPCAAESPPQPAAEGWRPALAHGLIPYTVTEADHRQFAERGYLVLPPVLDCAALDALVHDVQRTGMRRRARTMQMKGRGCRQVCCRTSTTSLSGVVTCTLLLRPILLPLCLSLCLSVSLSLCLCLGLSLRFSDAVSMCCIHNPRSTGTGAGRSLTSPDS